MTASNGRTNSARKNASKSTKASAKKPVLLTGGNPQIAKADGDAPVQAYIAAMPGWKSNVGRRLDALIVRTVPRVQKAVRWNSPFYGIEGQGWFLSFHCFDKYIKLAFFRGTSLRPVPPVESKVKDVRYFHIYENEPLNEKQLARWVKQASQLPGERMGVTTTMKKTSSAKTTKAADSPSKRIDARIKDTNDWRGKTLTRVRKLIKEAEPDVVEEWKWAKASSPGIPVWSLDGIICTGESYKDKVKLTFAKGASIKDPARLFNSSLDGNVRRAIDIHEGEDIDATAFKTLVRQAIALNRSDKAKSSKKTK